MRLPLSSAPTPRPRLSLILGMGLALAPGAGRAAPPQDSAPRPPASASAVPDAASNPVLAARALYSQGVEHLEKKEWRDAHAALSAAWAFKQHWQIAMMLGWAEMEIGQVRSAVNHLTTAATDPEPKDKSVSEKIASLLLEAKGRLPHVRIEGAPPGAALSIDGEAAGKAPLMEPVPIDPGSHTVTAELGTRRISQLVSVPVRVANKAEEPVTVTIVWPSEPAASGSGSPVPVLAASPSVQEEGSGAPSMVPVIVLGAAGGAAALAGLGVFIGSEVKGAEALQARDGYLMLPAGKQTDAEKSQVQGLLEQQDSLITGAVVLWIGAAVLGGGAAGYYLVQSSHEKDKSGQVTSPKASLHWAPVASPAGAGVVVRGFF